MKNNLVPTTIVDRNGKQTVVYKKPQRGTSNSTLAGVPPTGLPSSEAAPSLIDLPIYEPFPGKIRKLLNRRRNDALLEVSEILRKGIHEGLEQGIYGEYVYGASSVGQPQYTVSAVGQARAKSQLADGYSEALSALELLDTDTLEYITNAYRSGTSAHAAGKLSEMFRKSYLTDLKNSREDIGLLARNVISYPNTPRCAADSAIVFNGLRKMYPDFDRPDLYNLPEDKRQWATNVMRISRDSHTVEDAKKESFEVSSFGESIRRAGDYLPHMPEELITYIRDNPDKVDALEETLWARRVVGSSLVELVTTMDESGASALNDGAL